MADTDTSHPSDKLSLFPWTSLSQEKILQEIQKEYWARALDISTRIKDSTATTPTNRAIVNITPKSETEQASDRFLGVCLQQQLQIK